MPLDPHTWNSDFATATLLDGDLYLSQGNYFIANGIRFHARRPVYKSYNAYTTGANSLANGNWGLAYADVTGGNTQASVIADTPGVLGAWFDPNTSGNIRLSSLLAGSGLNAFAGGLMLATSYCLWAASANNGEVASGFGDYTTPASIPASQGTFQGLNNAHQTCTFCIDLVDSTSIRWGSVGFNGSGGTLTPVGTANADGSGWASRFHAHWASVYPANGHTVVNLPAPLTPWSSSTALTSSLLNGNTGLRGPLRFLNMPPVLQASQGTSQSLTANTDTTITTMSAAYDSYSGLASNTYTVPFNGLYFVHGYVGINSISGNLRAGVNINGTTYWGPKVPAPGTGKFAATKTQIFSLNAGDTIKLRGFSTATTTTTTSNTPRLVVVYMGQLGTPSPLPQPPDTTFRWTAGTQGPVDSLFNAHIANDLIFLTQRPYLLAYQASAQTGITAGSTVTTTMDTIQGIVHGDPGDNYSGWSAGIGSYVAQRAGWYMAVQETFMAQPTLSVTPSVVAMLGLNPHGTDVFDRYQQSNMVVGSAGAGATAVSYYYLRPGDSIKPGLATYDSTSTTISTDVSVGNSHFEVVWLGE